MNKLGPAWPGVFLDFATGDLTGSTVREDVRTLGELSGVFSDEGARSEMDPNQVVYRVQSFLPVPEGTPGGLFYGTSHIASGKVGAEYFMTKGHFHSRREAGEFYWGIEGEGLLLLMSEDGDCRSEKVARGTLHYIPGHTAHRLVNTGSEALTVGACWPSDAGHDYQSVQERGFSVRVLDGPRLVEAWK
jgi:glucose-6-phosphate isomerase